MTYRPLAGGMVVFRSYPDVMFETGLVVGGFSVVGFRVYVQLLHWVGCFMFLLFLDVFWQGGVFVQVQASWFESNSTAAICSLRLCRR